jgi:hypothetical protein
MSGFFWTNPTNQPTRQFRFMIMNGAGSWWWAKSCTIPSYDISVEEYKLINNKFKYPGVATWNDVTISIVDVEANATAVYQSLLGGGFHTPTMVDDEKPDGLSKRLLHNQTKVLSQKARDMQQKVKPSDGALLQIIQLDGDGSSRSTWTLHGAFIKSTNFGSLDYSSDELVTLELVISYDYATLE